MCREKTMRSINRQLVRCPQPLCGGQLLLHYERLLWGIEDRYLACSLCGREWKVPTRVNGETRPAVAGATG